MFGLIFSLAGATGKLLYDSNKRYNADYKSALEQKCREERLAEEKKKFDEACERECEKELLLEKTIEAEITQILERLVEHRAKNEEARKTYSLLSKEEYQEANELRDKLSELSELKREAFNRRLFVRDRLKQKLAAGEKL